MVPLNRLERSGRSGGFFWHGLTGGLADQAELKTGRIGMFRRIGAQAHHRKRFLGQRFAGSDLEPIIDHGKVLGDQLLMLTWQRRVGLQLDDGDQIPVRILRDQGASAAIGGKDWMPHATQSQIAEAFVFTAPAANVPADGCTDERVGKHLVGDTIRMTGNRVLKVQFAIVAHSTDAGLHDV